MKVALKKIPDIQDLSSAYDAFIAAEQTSDFKSGVILNGHGNSCQSLALYSQWARFDSRLGEICVRFLFDHWRHLNPIELHSELKLQPWPSVMGVFTEFVDRQMERGPSQALFRGWKEVVTLNFPRAHWEQFFIGKRRIGGKAMFEDARFSLEEYRKWGYLSREILVNKPKLKAGTYGLSTRLEMLKELLLSHTRITTAMYWDAIGHCVSKRQAERDLLAFRGLVPVGNSKGRYFIRP